MDPASSAYWSTFSRIVEAFLSVIAIVESLLTIYVICNTLLLHRNLRLILCEFIFMDACLLLWRIVEVLAFDGNVGSEIGGHGKFTIALYIVLTSFSLLYERTWAIYYNRSYEKAENSLRVFLSLLVVKLFFVVLLSGIRMAGGPVAKNTTYTYTVMGVITVVLALFYCVFLYIAMKNRKITRSIANDEDLTSKYQRVEVVKSSKMILIIVPWNAAILILMVVGLGFLIAHFRENFPQLYPITQSSFYVIFFSFRVIVSNMICIGFHRHLRKTAWNLFRRCRHSCWKRCWTPQVIPVSPQVESYSPRYPTSATDGTPIVSRSDHVYTHMAMLKDMWASDKAPTEAVVNVLQARRKRVKERSKHHHPNLSTPPAAPNNLVPEAIEMSQVTRMTATSSKCSSYQSINT